jgi:phosphohistidine phosphatase
MPRLVVLRHAKAVTGFGLRDVDRPLADRGRRDTARAGDRLRTTGPMPDLVLCSIAVRTRETLDGLALTGVPVSYEESIYDNDVDTLFDRIRETPDDVSTLLMIGHNPSFHELVQELGGDGPDAFPTCAMAVLEVPGPWADTWRGAGTLVDLWTPKSP